MSGDVAKSRRAAASMEPTPKSARVRPAVGDAREGLNGKEEVVEALIEGHFLGGLRGFAVHAEDGQGARGPREGLDVEDEDVEGGGQEGCDHSDEEHGGLSVKRD